jgi:hypothetical protein
MSLVRRRLPWPDLGTIGGRRGHSGALPISFGEQTKLFITLLCAEGQLALLLRHSAADRGIKVEFEILHFHVAANLQARHKERKNAGCENVNLVNIVVDRCSETEAR